MPLFLAWRRSTPLLALLGGLVFGFVLVHGVSAHSVHPGLYQTLSGGVLLWGLGGLLAAWLAQEPDVETSGWRPLSLALLWTSLEYLGSAAGKGDAGTQLACSQLGLLPLVQMADHTSRFGVSFVVALINAASLELLVAWWNQSDRKAVLLAELGSEGAARRACLAMMLVTLAATLGYGMRRLQEQPDGSNALRLVCVPAPSEGGLGGDPGRDQGGEKGGYHGGEHGGVGFSKRLQERERLTRELLSASPDLAGGLLLAVWPQVEVASLQKGHDLSTESINETLSETADALRGTLVVGLLTSRAGGQGELRAVGAQAGSERSFSSPWSYPVSSHQGQGRLSLKFGRTSMPPGTAEAAIYHAEGCWVYPFATTPEALQAQAQTAAHWGADVLTILGWLESEADLVVRERQLSLARLTAVETRRWVVVDCAPAPCAVVDPWGRLVRGNFAPERPGLVLSVRTHAERSLYARRGDLFAPLVVVGLGALCRRRYLLGRSRTGSSSAASGALGAAQS